MFGPEIIWYFILSIFLFPFYLIKNSISALFYFKINKQIINNLYELADELSYFIKMFNQPVELSKFNIRNELYTTHIDLIFGDRKLIHFTIKKHEDDISFGRGGTGGIGVSSIDKKKIDYDKIYEEMYKYAEKIIFLDFKEYHDWHQNTFYPIFAKHNLNYDFSYLRKILILISHDKDHKRYIKAENDIKKIFKDEETLSNFLKEIKNVYESKLILNELLKKELK